LIQLITALHPDGQDDAASVFMWSKLYQLYVSAESVFVNLSLAYFL